MVRASVATSADLRRTRRHAEARSETAPDPGEEAREVPYVGEGEGWSGVVEHTRHGETCIGDERDHGLGLREREVRVVGRRDRLHGGTHRRGVLARGQLAQPLRDAGRQISVKIRELLVVVVEQERDDAPGLRAELPSRVG